MKVGGFSDAEKYDRAKIYDRVKQAWIYRRWKKSLAGTKNDYHTTLLAAAARRRRQRGGGGSMAVAASALVAAAVVQCNRAKGGVHFFGLG